MADKIIVTRNHGFDTSEVVGDDLLMKVADGHLEINEKAEGRLAAVFAPGTWVDAAFEED